jgi:ferredoxin-NADP reductase
MEEHIVRITGIDQITHDVKRFRVEKPSGYSFIPGHATDVSINTDKLKDEKRPFTFTSLNSDPYLEFIIKIYKVRKGITSELDKLKAGDELIVRDTWGAISYKGRGVFIAGGAGITPFVSIFRDLNEKNELEGNVLLFGNKTRADIIMEDELKALLGDSFVNILSEEKAEGYYNGFFSGEFIKANIPDLNRMFYVCGPPRMMNILKTLLPDIGVSQSLITVEL